MTAAIEDQTKFKIAFTHWYLLTSTFHLQSLLSLQDINILKQGLRLYGCKLASPVHLSSVQYVGLVQCAHASSWYVLLRCYTSIITITTI